MAEFSSMSASSQNLASLFAEALQHHRASQLPQAEALYRQVLSIDPNHADALHGMGLIASQVGQPLVAADLIQRAIPANPFSATFQANLAGMLVTVGNID